MDKDDLIYIAGYLDGEGCFTVGEHWKIAITCENTHKPTIEWLHRSFGGYFGSLTRKEKAKWRPTYRWSVVGRDALRVCQLVAPHLQEKQEQALLLIGIQQTMGLPLIRHRLDPVVVEERRRLSDKVKGLKHVTS